MHTSNDWQNWLIFGTPLPNHRNHMCLICSEVTTNSLDRVCEACEALVKNARSGQ